LVVGDLHTLSALPLVHQGYPELPQDAPAPSPRIGVAGPLVERGFKQLHGPHDALGIPLVGQVAPPESAANQLRDVRTPGAFVYQAGNALCLGPIQGGDTPEVIATSQGEQLERERVDSVPRR